MQVGCDSKSALWNCFGASHINTDMASFNLVKAIRHQIHISPIKYKGDWVKAHLDDKKGVLDTWALVNIECDNEATHMWNKTVKSQRKTETAIGGHMPGEEWMVYIKDNRRVCNDFDSQLYKHALKQYMIDYREQKGKAEKLIGYVT